MRLALTSALYLLLAALLASVNGQGCSQQSLTDAQRVALIMEDADPDKDGITVADNLRDVGENYDTNHDKIWTEEECVARLICRYGVTQYSANFLCADIMGGFGAIPLSTFDVPPFNTPGGLPYADFQAAQEVLLAEFASRNCVDRYLTLAEKVALIATDNDRNNDGIVDPSERGDDLIDHFDTDNDGNVTQKEFFKAWICLYGDNGKQARSLWELVSGGSPTFPITFFSVFQPEPVDGFKARETKRYRDYFMAHPQDNCVGHGPIIG